MACDKSILRRLAGWQYSRNKAAKYACTQRSKKRSLPAMFNGVTKQNKILVTPIERKTSYNFSEKNYYQNQYSR